MRRYILLMVAIVMGINCFGRSKVKMVPEAIASSVPGLEAIFRETIQMADSVGYETEFKYCVYMKNQNDTTYVTVVLDPEDSLGMQYKRYVMVDIDSIDAYYPLGKKLFLFYFEKGDRPGVKLSKRKHAFYEYPGIYLTIMGSRMIEWQYIIVDSKIKRISYKDRWPELQ